MGSSFFIVDVFVKGGPVMIPILICSILALTITLQRIRFFSKMKIASDVFMRRIKGALASGDFVEAMRICRKENHPLSEVIAAGIDHLNLPKEGLLDSMRQEALRQMKRLTKFHGVLSTISSVSPLLGLTGTVTGMITAFSVISTIGVGDPTALAGGISEALYTTAAGLFVGIPALVAYNWCEENVSSFEQEVEYCTLDLANFINDRGGEVARE